jgi:hypothetical protein
MLYQQQAVEHLHKLSIGESANYKWKKKFALHIYFRRSSQDKTTPIVDLRGHHGQNVILYFKKILAGVMQTPAS